jgi:hypothetical protein
MAAAGTAAAVPNASTHGAGRNASLAWQLHFHFLQMQVLQLA